MKAPGVARRRTRAPASAHAVFADAQARESLKLLRVVFGTVKQHYRDVERASGLGGAHLWALAEAAAAAGLRVSDLAQALLVHQSTASNLVDRLVAMGMLRRAPASEDQRVVRLAVTAKGRALLARAPGPVIGTLPDALQRMPPASLRRLNRSLTELVATMSRSDPGAATRPLATL